MKKNDHEMTVDFILYPGEKDILEERIKLILKGADTLKSNVEKPVKAILVPHAGWTHCDKIMAAGYSSVSKCNFKRVVILSRVHREPEKAVFLPQFSSYLTPLGGIEVDQLFLSELSKSNSIFKYDNVPHIEEHSIEVQLPFIKYLWPEAKIVPILTGKPSISLVRKTADSLCKVSEEQKEDTLFIISSSLSSYDTEEKTKKETDLFISQLNSGNDWEAFPDMMNTGEIGACSADCLSVIQKIQNGHVSIDILKMKYWENLDRNEKRVCFGAIVIR